MGIHTNFQFLNADDPAFKAAATARANSKTQTDWEDEHGTIKDRPGAPVGGYKEEKAAIAYTDDEYGGWIIDLSKVPEGTTHIVVHRG